MSFDEKAIHWDSDPMKLERARNVAQAIQQAIPQAENLSAIEYGCGTGLVSFCLKDFFQKIALMDDSDGMLAVLREKIATTGVSNFTALKCNLLTDAVMEKAHVVFTSMTLHHMGDTASAVRALSSMVSPSGYLCIADLVTEDGSFHSSDFIGPYGFAETDIRYAFAAANIQYISYQTIYCIHKQGREYPVFLALGKK